MSATAQHGRGERGQQARSILGLVTRCLCEDNVLVYFCLYLGSDAKETSTYTRNYIFLFHHHFQLIFVQTRYKGLVLILN